MCEKKKSLLLEYDDFRTGLSFAEVYHLLRYNMKRDGRHHITRHTVLGKWHEIKLDMYDLYCKEEWRVDVQN